MHKKLFMILGIIVFLTVFIFCIIMYNNNLIREQKDFSESEWAEFLNQFDDLLNPERILSYEDMIKLITIVYNNNTSTSSKNRIVHIEFNYTVFDLTEDSSFQLLKNIIKETEEYKIVDTSVSEGPKLEKITLTNYYEK